MDTNYLDKFENQLHDLVAVYLLQKDGVDNVLPETHDMEEKWGEDMHVVSSRRGQGVCRLPYGITRMDDVHRYGGCKILG